MVRKLTIYARYAGHSRSTSASPPGGRTVMSRTSSVMAIASTPSLNASRRPVLSVLRRERSGFSAPATAPLPARPARNLRQTIASFPQSAARHAKAGHSTPGTLLAQTRPGGAGQISTTNARASRLSWQAPIPPPSRVASHAPRHLLQSILHLADAHGVGVLLAERNMAPQSRCAQIRMIG